MRTLAQTRWFRIVERDNTPEFIVCNVEVMVIAIDDGGAFVMLEEPAYAFDDKQLLFPGGGIEAGEDAISAGQRELREETGFAARKITYLAKLRPWSKYLNVTTHVVVAEELYSAPLQGDEEYVPVVRMKTRPALEAMIASGELLDARVIAALSLWSHANGNTSL